MNRLHNKKYDREKHKTQRDKTAGGTSPRPISKNITDHSKGDTHQQAQSQLPKIEHKLQILYITSFSDHSPHTPSIASGFNSDSGAVKEGPRAKSAPQIS